jgi:hypothetical protein
LGIKGLDAEELGEGFAVHLVDRGTLAVEAGDGGIVGVGVADGGDVRHRAAAEALHGDLPDFGFDPAETAEHPLAVNQLVNERALGGGGGTVFGGELGFELFELGTELGADDDALRIESGLERVLAGADSALDGAGSGAALCVAAIGRELFF